jgi:hypothetical protein
VDGQTRGQDNHGAEGKLMTDTERQELREWSAGVMGWERVYADGLPMWKFPNGRWDSVKWTPDTDYNQLFNLFIPRMRELGFELKFGYGDTVQGILCWVKFTSESYKSYYHNKDIALAILLAAKATGVK